MRTTFYLCAISIENWYARETLSTLNLTVLVVWACQRVLTSAINKVVQDDLNRVAKWIECSKLILNPSKNKTVLFGSRAKSCEITRNFCIQLHGKILEKVPKFSYVGVFLEKTLSWKDHVEYVSSKVSCRLARLALEASK